MRMREFIKNNRKDIDEAIKGACPNIRPLNDNDRAQWINNDEGLYNWARREGVRI